MKKELIVKKPNQTITISNGDITLTQRKAYNVLIHKAQQELRLNIHQESFTIPIIEIKEKAGIEATDNFHLKEDLKKLMNIKIECHEPIKKRWSAFVLLSQVIEENGLLKFSFPPMIREALIQNDYYTPIDLMILKSFTCKYAVILYEIAIRYNKVKIPKYEIEEFKKITGTEDYKDFRDLRIKCIEPGIKDINEKSDIIMKYEAIAGNRGRKITEIKFEIFRKDLIKYTSNDDILNYLPELERNKISIKRLLNAYISKGAEYLVRNIEYSNAKSKSNYHAFLAKALKDDWGMSWYEKKEADIKAEEQKQNAILEAEKAKREEIERVEQAKRLEIEKQEQLKKKMAEFKKNLSQQELEELKTKYIEHLEKTNPHLKKSIERNFNSELSQGCFYQYLEENKLL